jgi:hypothetical protein
LGASLHGPGGVSMSCSPAPDSSQDGVHDLDDEKLDVVGTSDGRDGASPLQISDGKCLSLVFFSSFFFRVPWRDYLDIFLGFLICFLVFIVFIFFFFFFSKFQGGEKNWKKKSEWWYALVKREKGALLYRQRERGAIDTDLLMSLAAILHSLRFFFFQVQ